MMDYQGMVVLAANQAWWTWEVEDVFRKVRQGGKSAMKDYAKMLNKQMDDLVVCVCTPVIPVTHLSYMYMQSSFSLCFRLVFSC